jgi:hypothetical protein
MENVGPFWNILQAFGIFWSYWYIFPILVSCAKKNLATHVTLYAVFFGWKFFKKTWGWKLIRKVFRPKRSFVASIPGSSAHPSRPGPRVPRAGTRHLERSATRTRFFCSQEQVFFRFFAHKNKFFFFFKIITRTRFFRMSSFFFRLTDQYKPLIPKHRKQWTRRRMST